jgi:hypothetical protein
MLFGNGAKSRASLEDEVDRLIDRGTLFVANHSLNSQVQLIRLLEIVPATQLLVVQASLGSWLPLEFGEAIIARAPATQRSEGSPEQLCGRGYQRGV